MSKKKKNKSAKKIVLMSLNILQRTKKLTL